MGNLLVNIIDELPEACDIPEELIIKVLTTAYQEKFSEDVSVNILIVDDEKIAEMNQQFLNHEGPTDVLAFDDGEIEDGLLLLGDIAISADTAKKMAAEKGMKFSEELALYALHGFLHLSGMRDNTPELKEEMITEQKKIFTKLNLEYVV